MTDPKEIYLEPKCCFNPEIGRCWATDDEWPLAPGDEDNGHYPATRYVRADLAHAAEEAADRDALTAALVALTRHGIAPDIQELLLHGNPELGVSQGALAAAIRATNDRRCVEGEDD